MIETQSVATAIEANSRAFFKESVAKAILAEKDPDQWRFAIIAIVQSFELLLKSRLADVHPAFVYESIDSPTKYVGIHNAIDRISSPLIGKHTFSEKDRKRLKTAITSRNDYTHGAGHYTPQHAQSVYFEIFALLVNFYKDVQGVSLVDIITAHQYNFIVTNIKSRNYLRNRAFEKIKSKNISPYKVRQCCECLEETFVFFNCEDTCYTCQHSAPIIECPCCGEAWYFEHEFIDLTDEFYTSFDEGQTQILNRYMTEYDSVCPDCAQGERERISNLRKEEQDKYVEEAIRMLVL